VDIGVPNEKENQTMFDRLVISAKEKSKGRTKRFFLMTTVIYSLVFASALVASVFAANVSLNEASEVIKIAPALPPPALPPAGVRSAPSTAPSQAAARPSIYNVKPFIDIQNSSENKAPVIPVSSRVSDSGISGPPGGSGIGVPGGGVDTGVLGGDSASTEPPPLPAPTPKVKPEPEPQPKAQENKILRVASQVLTGKAVVKRTPDYPALAKQAHVEGSIVVEIVISPEGRVESARALNGHLLLTKAAVDAAYAWRFEPTILNGLPVRVTGVITFNFKLN
jgi:protein TonB